MCRNLYKTYETVGFVPGSNFFLTFCTAQDENQSTAATAVAVVAVVAVAAAATKTSAAIAMAGLTGNNQPKMAEEEMVRTTTTMGKDGNDNRQR